MSGLPAGIPYTPSPDVLYDLWLPHLEGAELKVVLYFIRRSFGHQSTATADLSISDICKGFEGQDQGTGLERSSAHQAVRTLVMCGLVLEKRGRHDNSPRRYAINLKWLPESVPKISTCRKSVRTGNQYTRTDNQYDLDGASANKEARTENQYVPKISTNSVPKISTPIPTVETEEKTDTPALRAAPKGANKREKPIGDHPESLEACVAWFVEHKYSEAAAKDFWFKHEANGWTQGLAAKPIKKWTAAAHYWMRPKEWQHGGARASPTPPPTAQRETVRVIEDPDEYIRRRLGEGG